MTSWLTTVMTRRVPLSRHIGAGYDADMRRMAHELSMMEQAPAAPRRTRRVKIGGRTDAASSFRAYPNHAERMADRHHPAMSTR